jgi:diguanylate cyclase (GGDEF)-like protein
MAHTIFILGTDPQQCKDLKDILQGRTTDAIITGNGTGTEVPHIRDSDTVIITSEEKDTGLLYRHLLTKLEEQMHQKLKEHMRRAELLGQLIRMFSSSVPIEDLLERVVTKSTEVLGDTAFIVLCKDNGQLQLEAAYSTNHDRLVKMLMTMVNFAGLAGKSDFLRSVVEHRERVLIPNLSQHGLTKQTQTLVEKHEIMSVLAVPIQTKEEVLGAFIAMTAGSRKLTDDDLGTAAAVADFTAIALENAGLFQELQRSAITDSLTAVYNAGFFTEVLGRETARADRYTTPLSLLMIDVDGFKIVNDTFGHVVGNKVLTTVAKTLEHTVRNTDYVFRCGGDEFGVIVPGTDVEGAMNVALKILQRVETSEILSGLGYSGKVTVSIGLSEYRPGNHYETLVAEADQALYMAKRSTKNCARAFKP